MKYIVEIGGANAVRTHFIELPENLQERLNTAEYVTGRTNSLSAVSRWNRLGGVMGGDEEGAEVSEPLKIGSTVFVKLVG